nr:hypothetical protein [Pseudomonadota bacterium]
MKEVLTLQEAALKTILSNPKLMAECEQFLISRLDTQFLDLSGILRDAILDELIATRGDIIANAIINGGRYNEDELTRLEKSTERNFQDNPEFKELQQLPHELITLMLAAIRLRKQRLETIHTIFINSFSLSYPFDVAYHLDSQNRIDYAKSVISWLKKHLTSEDIRNNEKLDFNLYQFAFVTKDAEFFHWFWELAGPETQQNFLNISKGEINPFFASVEMGMLWFCELLYWQADKEQQLTLLRNQYMLLQLAAANNRLDVFDWLSNVIDNIHMMSYSAALAAAIASSNMAMINKLWRLATTKETKRVILESDYFDAFRQAVSSGNLEICKLVMEMAKEINAENDMLMAERGTGSMLNIAAAKGHLNVCQWIAEIANDQQLPILLMNMNVYHLPSNRSLSTVALYRWVWNIASPEMRQVILMLNNCEVFKLLLEIGLIPICRLLIENASNEQRESMLISGLTFTNYDDKFSRKAFDWAWDHASAKQKETLLD